MTKESEGGYTNVKIISEADLQTLEYTDLDGAKRSIELDAEDEVDAVFEAINLLGVMEEEIEIEYV